MIALNLVLAVWRRIAQRLVSVAILNTAPKRSDRGRPSVRHRLNWLFELSDRLVEGEHGRLWTDLLRLRR